MKTKRFKPTPDQLDAMKIAVKRFRQEERKFDRAISKINKWLSKETGIPGAELFFSDGELAGIGNQDRTMELQPSHNFNEPE